MKKIFLFLPFLIIFCEQSCLAENPRVALMLEHGEMTAWTRLLQDGLKKAASDFAINPSIVIAAPNAEQADIFRQTAKENDLVIVTGENLHELLRDNAGNFRKVKFGCIDAGIRAPNIACITFADQEASFLAGVAAALLTKDTAVSGINGQLVIGWFSGMDTPAMRTLYNGYLEGAKFANSQLTVAQQVLNSFVDDSDIVARTNNLLDQGADVIALAAGAGNEEAKKTLKTRGAWRIDLDQESGEPGAIGAIVKAADKAVYEIISMYVSGNFKGKEIQIYNLANGGVDFTGLSSFLRQTGRKAPADLERRVKELRNEIIKGSIPIRSFRTRTLCDCLD